MTTASDDGQWRDERKLPLDELMEAVAVSPADGQSDDLTGNDTGQELGREAPTGEPLPDEDDPTSAAARAKRTDFTGPVGPN
jgi:hypothetical protein